MIPHRLPRINELLQQIIGEAIQKFIDFPQGIFVTVSRVETAENLSVAHIFLTVYPAEKLTLAESIIKKYMDTIQRDVNAHLRIKRIPRIKFHIAGPNEELEKILDDLEARK